MKKRPCIAAGLHIAGLALLGSGLSRSHSVGMVLGCLIGIVSWWIARQRPRQAVRLLAWIWFAMGWAVAITEAYRIGYRSDPWWRHGGFTVPLYLQGPSTTEFCTKLGIAGGWMLGLAVTGIAFGIARLAGWGTEETAWPKEFLHELYSLLRLKTDRK